MPWLGRPPALGAVAVLHLDGAGAPPRIAETFEQSPWLVPCVVVTPATLSPSMLQVVWGLPSQPAFVIQSAPSARVAPALVLATVATRPTPTAPHLVAYVIGRTRSVALGQTLDVIWSPKTAGARREADRTIRYRLGRLGPLGHHDWLRVHRLIRAKTEGWNLSVERQAQLVGTEARTLRSWAARYLGCSLKTFRLMAGWEWIVESVLRRGGYLPDPAEAPARITRPATGELPRPTRPGSPIRR